MLRPNYKIIDKPLLPQNGVKPTIKGYLNILIESFSESDLILIAINWSFLQKSVILALKWWLYQKCNEKNVHFYRSLNKGRFYEKLHIIIVKRNIKVF